MSKFNNSLDLVSGLNATDKAPIYEMPLIYVFGVLGLGEQFFIGVLGNSSLSLAFFMTLSVHYCGTGTPRSIRNGMQDISFDI